MTPKEFQVTFEVYVKNKQEHYNDLIYLAWHIEALARTKKLPRLSKLIKNNKLKRRKPQTEDEMLKAIKLFNAAYGGDVK